MKRTCFYFLSIACFLFFTSVSYSQTPTIRTVPLTKNVYVHISYISFNDQLFECNGLYVVTDAGVIIIDTPPDEDQTQQLVDSIENRHHQKVISCLITHYHNDANGGVEVLEKSGVTTWSSLQTQQLSKLHGEKVPTHHFVNDTTFRFGNATIETYYPGEGHTIDNVVFWLPGSKILYGGCLIKSIESTGLGNTADANLSAWPISIQNVIDKYPDCIWVVPGHQKWSDDKILFHTLQLLSKP